MLGFGFEVIGGHEWLPGGRGCVQYQFLDFLGCWLLFDVHRVVALFSILGSLGVVGGHWGSLEVTGGSMVCAMSVFILPGLLAFV